MELKNEGGNSSDLQQPKKRGRKPGQRKRTQLELARDRYEIEKLRLRYRMPPVKIAEHINKFYEDEIPEEGKLPPHLSIQQVKHEIMLATKGYRELESEIITEKRLELIRQFYDLATQSQERYDASVADRITTTSEERVKDSETTTVTKETVVNTDGNARYLDIKKECLKFIAELEAVLPPRKTALTNPDGTEPFQFEGVEELKRLAALAAEVLPKPEKEAK